MHGPLPTEFPLWLSFSACVAAFMLSFGLIATLWRSLKLYAPAKPNARSSHRTPTPQSGGIVVVATTLTVTTAAFAFGGIWPAGEPAQWAAVATATILLASTGALDDLRDLAVLARLALQFVAVALVIAAVPAELRVISWLPWWGERAALVLAGVWFVNVVNFMDGIDWMTVAEVVPIAGGLVLLGALGALPGPGIVTASALGGAMIGFAPFNRPVARLFLGDVGSLPIGLILAWLLFLLASDGHLAAAVLLPLYYLADTAVTLANRLLAGEKIWMAHRSHCYQRAVDHGFSVTAVVGRVLATNVILMALAASTIVYPTVLAAIIATALGGTLVAVLLARFAFARP